MGNPVKEIPVFDPNKPFKAVSGDVPAFDPSRPFKSIEKKNLGGNDLKNGLQSSQPDLNVEIPIVSLEDNNAKDVFTLAQEHNDLTNKKESLEQPIGGSSFAMGTTSETEIPDVKAQKQAADLKDYMVNTKGVDPLDVYEEIKDVPKDQLLKHKTELADDREQNNPLYQRKLANFKWRNNFGETLLNEVDKGNIDPDNYNRIKEEVRQLPEFTGTGDFTNQRTTIQSLAKDIQIYGGENKDKILKDFAIEVSKVYGNAYNNKFSDTIKDSPEGKYLNDDEQLALQYIKDVAPDKAGQYDRLMIDPKTLKDNPDALKGYNHLKQTLEETGIGLQQNSVTEELNNLKKQATKNDGLTPEQLQRATDLEKKQDELAQKRNELDNKYPDRIENKVDDAVQEIFGQRLGFESYAKLKTAQAFKNTAEGVWEAVSTPFMSDASNNLRELAIMGENIGDENFFHKTDKNKSLLTDQLVIQPELQKQIDAIKNNGTLTESGQQKQITELLKNNLDKFGRVPIKGGKFNINPSSILYGLTDLGTTLLPFIALETATGGGATAGVARKFISTFTAAAATSFHDEYASALLSGKSQSEAYKQAMGMTAISSLAMAGANTPSKIKAMLNPKTSAGKLILSMSEDAIQKVLDKGTPKGLKAIGQAIKERAKELPKQFGEGVKTGAEFEGAMTLANEAKHQIYNTDIDREQNFKQSLLGIANFGIMGAGLGQAGFKSPTELQKSSLLKFGENPKEYISVLDELKKEGKVTPAEYDHRKALIESSETAFKSLPKSLDEKQKSEYIYQTVIKNEANKGKSDLPPKQAAEAEKTALAADHTRGLILDEPTDKQLDNRKGLLERKLEPKKDAEGKSIELPEKEKLDMQAELEAINNVVEERSVKVADEAAKKLTDTKLSKPVKGLDEQGIPNTGDVPPPVEVKTEPNEEEKITNDTNTSTEAGKEQPVVTDIAPETAAGKEESGETVGISHESLKKIADKLGLKQPERGTFLTPEEQLKRGKALLEAGADPEQVAADFKKDVKVDADSISVARAHFVNLTKEAQKALDEHGKDSPEFKKAQDDMQKWQDDVLKPMGTASGGAFSALQGEEDLDTGSFVSLKNAFRDKFGKEPNPKQEKAIKELSEKVKGLTSQVEDLKNKLTEALDKISKEGNTGKSSKEKNAKTADKINKIADNIENFGRAKGLEGAEKSGFAPDVQKMVANAMRKIAEGVREGKSISKAILDAIKEFANEKLDAIGLRDAITNGLKEAGIDEKDFDILTKFDGKKWNDFSIEDAKEIWEYAKEEYLDKGSSYVDMVGGVSKDLGLSGEQVRRAITSPKGINKISDEIYKQNQHRTDAINQAKSWLKDADNSKIKNFLKAIPNAFFRAKTFGHGTVGAITHAAPHLFQPSKWKKYFPFWVKQFKYAFGSTANYNKAMEDLKNDKDFIFWKRNGLAVDPKEKYDDYQGDFANKKSPNRFVKFLNRAGVAGDRGFNALKVYRLTLAKMYYDKLSNSEKADPETAPRIAELVNHGTGTTEVKTPRWSNTVFFAPKLEISRWQRLVTDPLKALHTVKRLSFGQHVNAVDKVAAKRVARNAGETLATYASLLALNSAVLSLTGSKQKINYLNPLDNDWMKPKIGGTTVDATGGMLSTMRFVGSLAEAAHNAYTGSKKDLKEKPQDSDYKKIGQQARYKLSPFLSTLVDWATGTDAMGRPVPFSNVPPRAGEERYGVWEYLLHQQTPIPAAEYFKEVASSMKDRGMETAQVRDVLKGVLVGVLSGGTGMKVQDIEDKTGVADKQSTVHDYLQSKEAGIKPFRKEQLQPVDENGNDIKVTDEGYKKFIAERERIITQAVTDLLKGGGIYEDKDGIPQQISAEDAKNISKDELDSFLMTKTTQADKEAIQTVFNGEQKKEPKTNRKIEIWQ